MTRPRIHPTILVPLDGSDFAEQALPLATSLARSTNRQLQLVLVQEIPLWPDETGATNIDMIKRIVHADGETYLRSVEQRFMGPDLVLNSVALPAEGRPVGQVLSEYIQDNPAEMIVLASHGRGGVKRAWLGSVADYLLRHVNVPVIVTRPGCAAEPQSDQILVPLDGSPLAETVLADVCAIAAAANTNVTLLQVVQPVMHTLSTPEAPYVAFDAELTAMQRGEAENYLGGMEEVVRARGITCTSYTIVAHNVAEAILEVARPAHCTMIAMATHGLGGVRRLLLGSCTDKVIRGAEVPVLVYRPTGTTAALEVPLTRTPQAGPRSCTV
jgi:nucleotide-binding universal stress UspA family protein